MVSSDPTYDELTEEYGQNGSLAVGAARCSARSGGGKSRCWARSWPSRASTSVWPGCWSRPTSWTRGIGRFSPRSWPCFDRYEAIDQITVAAELSTQGRLQEAGGQAYLNQLVYELPATVGAEHYARLVQRAATYRDMIRAAGEIGELAYRAPIPTWASR